MTDWNEYARFDFAGVENLVGGSGKDYFTFYYDAAISGSLEGGGSNKDILSYRKYNQGVEVDLSNSAATGVGGPVTGIEYVFGSDYDDFIRGDDNNNRLGGYAGNDIILGMGGDNIVHGGDGSDTLRGPVESTIWSITGNHAGSLQDATGEAYSVFDGIESLVGSSADDTLVGPDDATGIFDWLIIGDNRGYTTNWNEYGRLDFHAFENLTGGAGYDRFRYYYYASISGSIDGGGHDKDSLWFRNYNSGVIVDLMNQTATGVGGPVLNIERVLGSVYDDFIRGDDNANRLDGYHSGNDIIRGMGGYDQIYGGTGNNILIGGESSDYIYSRGNEDILIAGWTVYDTHAHADVIFSAMRDVWTSEVSFEERIETLRTGISVGDGETVSGTFALNNDTVADDSDDDQIHDTTGRDWYFASLAEALDFDSDEDWLN